MRTYKIQFYNLSKRLEGPILYLSFLIYLKIRFEGPIFILGILGFWFYVNYFWRRIKTHIWELLGYFTRLSFSIYPKMRFEGPNFLFWILGFWFYLHNFRNYFWRRIKTHIWELLGFFTRLPSLIYLKIRFEGPNFIFGI